MEKDKVQNDKVQSDGKISSKDLERVNIEPAALSDADLDNVAGGATIIIRPNTNVIPNAGFASKTYDVK